ncbi:MAG TPA: zinc dependent phospholipase C family protein, partial [Aggregatilineales bacterium]|nr:zinc dependent phospholipase C family protein [Aggregatilineales bacterium]
MATWVAHFRMAEAILNQGINLNRKMFVVGNIAPDSGLLNEGTLSYDPPKHITHWIDQDNNIQPELFYVQHIAAKNDLDGAELDFCLGYYCHLLADWEWITSVWRSKKEKTPYVEMLAENAGNIWEIKKDWYGLDFLYLAEHPDSIFFTDFVQVEEVPDYLDYFPEGAFTRRVDDTRKFYLGKPDWDLDRPYIYLSRKEWDDYVQ